MDSTPAPVPPLTDADLRLICDEASRLERRRWLGFVLLYSPLFFILSFVGIVLVPTVMQGPGPGNPPLGPVQMAVAVAMAFSPLVMVVGAVVRFFGARALNRMAAQWSIGELPGVPGVQRGERLGAWVVKRADAGHLTLIHRWGPPATFEIMRWGCWSLLILIVALGVFQAINGPPAGFVGPALGVLVLGYMMSPFLVDRRIEVESSGELRYVRSVGRFLPAYVERGMLERVLIADAEVGLVRVGGHSGVVCQLAHPPLGIWQARRLAATVAKILAGGVG